jgi:gamma-glutamyl:cysteine ligase YbdK (ATP-grasp superfamily)
MESKDLVPKNGENRHSVNGGRSATADDRARRIALTILALVEQIHQDAKEINLRSGKALELLKRIIETENDAQSEQRDDDPTTTQTVRSLKRDTAIGTLLMAGDQVDRMASLFRSILALHRT